MLHPQRSAPRPLSWSDGGFADPAAFHGRGAEQWADGPAPGWPECHQPSPSQSYSHSPHGAGSRASSQPRTPPQSQPHSRPPSPLAGGVVNPWAQQHQQPQQQWPSRSCSPPGGAGLAHRQPHHQPQPQRSPTPPRSPTPSRSAQGFAPPPAQPYQQAAPPRSPRDSAAFGPSCWGHSADAPAGFGCGAGAWAQPEQHHNPFRAQSDCVSAPPAGAQPHTPPSSPGGRYSGGFSPAIASGAHAAGLQGTAGPCGGGGGFDGGCGGAGPGQLAWAGGFEPAPHRGHPARGWSLHAGAPGTPPAAGGGASPRSPHPQQWCHGGPPQQHPSACGGGCHGAAVPWPQDGAAPPWPQAEVARAPSGAAAPGCHGGGAYWPQAELAAPGGGGGAAAYHDGAPPGGCWPPSTGPARDGWGGPVAGGCWQAAGFGWPGGDEAAAGGFDDSTPSRSSRRKHKRDKHKPDTGGDPRPPAGAPKSNMEVLKELRVLGISAETGYRTADIVAAISQCEGSTPRAVKLLWARCPERRPTAGVPDAQPAAGRAEPSAAAAARPPGGEDAACDAGHGVAGRSGSAGARQKPKLFGAGSWLQRRSSREAAPDGEGDQDFGRTGTESSAPSFDGFRSQEGPKLAASDVGGEERSPASRWGRARALVFRRRPSKESDFMDRDEH